MQTRRCKCAAARLGAVLEIVCMPRTWPWRSTKHATALTRGGLPKSARKLGCACCCVPASKRLFPASCKLTNQSLIGRQGLILRGVLRGDTWGCTGFVCHRTEIGQNLAQLHMWGGHRQRYRPLRAGAAARRARKELADTLTDNPPVPSIRPWAHRQFKSPALPFKEQRLCMQHSFTQAPPFPDASSSERVPGGAPLGPWRALFRHASTHPSRGALASLCPSRAA